MAIPTYFTLWTDEAEALKNADQKKLAKAIRRLDLSDEAAKKRPLKLRIPEQLRDALDAAAELGYKKIEVLLSAAREYRRRNPPEPDWEESPAAVENEPKGGERRGQVYRLSPADHALLQNIGRGCSHVANRYEAMLELASIIEEMDLPDLTDRERISVYVPLSEELHELLERRYAETGIPRAKIVLKALHQ